MGFRGSVQSNLLKGIGGAESGLQALRIENFGARLSLGFKIQEIGFPGVAELHKKWHASFCKQAPYQSFNCKYQ